MYEVKVELSLCYLQPTKTFAYDNGKTVPVVTAGAPVQTVPFSTHTKTVIFNTQTKIWSACRLRHSPGTAEAGEM